MTQQKQNSLPFIFSIHILTRVFPFSVQIYVSYHAVWQWVLCSRLFLMFSSFCCSSPSDELAASSHWLLFLYWYVQHFDNVLSRLYLLCFFTVIPVSNLNVSLLIFCSGTIQLENHWFGRLGNKRQRRKFFFSFVFFFVCIFIYIYNNAFTT